MTLPDEAIKEYQDIYEMLFKQQIPDNQANIDAESFIKFIFWLENNGYKKILIQHKNEPNNNK